MEKQIKIAAKLYECRDVAKRFYGPEYIETIRPYKHIIREVCKSTGKEILESLIHCLTMVQNNGFQMMLFNAAAVEMMENDN